MSKPVLLVCNETDCHEMVEATELGDDYYDLTPEEQEEVVDQASQYSGNESEFSVSIKRGNKEIVIPRPTCNSCGSDY
jgi:hypothetical protein